MRRPGPVLLACLLALLTGCGQLGGGGGAAVCGSATGTQVRFDPDLGRLDSHATTWLAAPWPADFRKTSRGTLRMIDFPGTTELISDYIGVAQGELTGYSTAGGIYLAFTGALDPATFPSGPAAGLADGATIQLVDVTPSSPGYGQRRPLRLLWQATATDFLPANTLAVGPAWGFPLRPKTTYALLVTTGVKDAGGHALAQPPRLAWLLGGDGRCRDHFAAAGPDDTVFSDFAPLRGLLKAEKRDPATIAAATVFTTQDTLGQMRAIHDQIEAAPAPAYDAAGWQAIGPNGSYSQAHSYPWSTTQTVQYHVMEGRYDAPNYMEGDVPYTSQGGAFHFENGKPVPVRTEHLRFVLTIPDAPPPDHQACYPIVIYQHGTGGDAYTFVNSATGARLAARGLAAIGIDQPLHGLRADGKGGTFDVGLATFNLPNIDAGRTVMRQGAVDTFSLTRFVRQSLTVPADKSPTGQAICFDPDRVLFFGHSQGGISGSMTAALETHIHTWMLSGSGGGISLTVMERTDPVNLKEIVAPLVNVPADQLSDLHPVITLIQTLVDVSDPLNYSPWWDRWGDPPLGQSVLMTSGLDDQDTPYRTADAEAVAARIPLVAAVDGSIAKAIPAYGILGMDPVAPPVSANLATGATGGFIQWPKPATHFVVFDSNEAIDASMHFLKSAAYEGGPVIRRDPSADAQ